MTNPTVFVACRFKPDATGTYTYTWTGEPLAPGDMVRVTDARTGGEKRVFVAAYDVEQPPFDCKPILGRYEPDEVPEQQPETVGDPLNLNLIGE